jgi:hypothetical protein
MSVTIPGRSFLSGGDEREIRQAVIDGVQTMIGLEPISLILTRLDDDGVPVALPAVTVARRFANRQPERRGSEAAVSERVGGEFRAYAPWDVQIGDTFVLADGSGQIVPPVVTKYDVTRASFLLDAGAP